MQIAPQALATTTFDPSSDRPPRRRRDWTSILFGVAIACTSATQLRLGGAPIGLGELLLLAWMSAAGLQILFAGRIHLTPVGWALVAFWLVALPVLLVGLIAGTLIGLPGTADYRDLVALLLSAIVSVMFVLLPRVEERTATAVRAMMPAIVIPSWLLLLVSATGRFNLGPIEIWYQHERFAAWSANPNQLAFALLPVPFLALENARGKRGRAKWYYLALAAGALPLGAASFSNAVMFAWAAGLLAQVVVFWIDGVKARGQRYFARARTIVIIPTVVLAVLAGVGVKAVQLAEKGLEAGYQGSGEHGADRVARWGYALQAVSMSPVVGLGPGTFSGPTGPFQEEEAHNTIIDWLTNTGVVGVTAFLALIGFVTWRAIVASELTRVTLMGAVMIFVSFHYMLRQPEFWFLVTVVGVAGASVRSRRAVPAAPGPTFMSSVRA